MFVAEPSVEQTIAILRWPERTLRIAPPCGKSTDPAIVAAATSALIATLCTRQLPDKAIDLIDEAASSIRTDNHSKPEELDPLDCRIIELKLEQQALMKESDEASKKTSGYADEELSDK
ncbi:hypothetical protein ACNKHW_16520 [Shigella flexneri]